MTVSGIALLLNGYEAPSAFREDRKNHSVPVAAVRMRKHRYTTLAQEAVTRRVDSTAGPDDPLRLKFRGPGRHSIWEHIETKASQILYMSQTFEYDEDFVVEPDVIDQLMRVLYFICDSTSVYPHISADGENGVAAVWYAGELSLEIIFDCDGDACAIVRSGTKLRSINLNEGGPRALREIRGHLGKLTSHVKTSNPEWRNLVG